MSSGTSEMIDRPLNIKIFIKSARIESEADFMRTHLIQGLSTCGDRVEIVEGDYESCDVAVILFSPRNGSCPTLKFKRHIRYIHSTNLLICESPILRDCEKIYTRFGFDHVHRLGRFPSFAYDQGRFAKIGRRMKPWRQDGSIIVVAGQVQGDYSLDGVDADEWIDYVTDFMFRRYENQVVIRPHPLDTEFENRFSFIRRKVTISRNPLEYDLDRSKAWISYTSGSSVDAVLAGVPSIALSRHNLAWEVSSHRIDAIEYPFMPDRKDWANKIAHSQWDRDEISSGTAWSRLRSLVEL